MNTLASDDVVPVQQLLEPGPVGALMLPYQRRGVANVRRRLEVGAVPAVVGEGILVGDNIDRLGHVDFGDAVVVVPVVDATCVF